MRRFVLVTATNSNPGRTDTVSAGIRKLKRGVDLAAFKAEYLSQFEIPNREEFVRGDTHVVISRSDGNVLQWAFTEYKEGDLLHAVRHLSREELLRGLKELLPLKDIPR